MVKKLNKKSIDNLIYYMLQLVYGRGGVFMKKYIGRYRVVCEFDRATLNPIKGDMYIQCSKSGQIYRIDNDTLAYYKPARGKLGFYAAS